MNSNQPTPNQSASQPPIGVRFGIMHLFYATALVAASVATIGSWGWLVAVTCLVCWSTIFASDSRCCTIVVLSMLLVCSTFCLIGYDTYDSREVGRRWQCSNNLKQITIALHNYHDVHGSLPPAYIADQNGKPMHSWRVLILPYLDQQALYDAYDFNEPWNGVNNRKLHNAMVSTYRCPSSSGHTHSNYYAVLGDDTCWPHDQGRRWSEISDGLANTVLVCEARGHGSNWMEPADISIEDSTRSFSYDVRHHHEGFFYEHWHGRNVALADGSVHFAGRGMSSMDWHYALTVNDGQRSRYLPSRLDRTVQRFKWDNCLRLAIFAILVVLPLTRLARRRRGRLVSDDDRMAGYRRGL